MIRLITGKAKSGKTHEIFEEMRAYKDGLGETSIILVVPEQFTLEAEKKYIEHLNGQGFIGTEILSFKRLCHKAIQETMNDSRVAIGDMGRMMLLRKLFKSMESDLKLYKSAYNKPGFLLRFHELIQELRQNRIDPKLFEQICSDLDPTSVLGMKAQDIQGIYKAYMSEKELLYFDDEAYYELFIEVAQSSKLIEKAKIWMDGFDSFSVQEYEIIRQLALYADQVSIALTWSEEEVFSHTARAVDRLKNMAQEIQQEFSIHPMKTQYMKSELQHFSLNLMAYPYQTQAYVNEDIQIHAATNRMDEIEKCALTIVESIRDYGYHWRDIAVVTNDISAYESGIKRIFGMYELPYFLDVKFGVLANPFIRFLLSIVKITNEPTQITHVVQLMKSGFMPFEPSEIDLFELYTKTHGLKTWHLKAPFKQAPERGMTLDQLNEVREKLIGFITPLLGLDLLSCEAYITLIYNSLLSVNAHDQIEKQVDAFVHEKQMDEAQIFAQIWNKTMALFDELVAIIGDQVMPVEELGQLIETGVEHMEIGVLPLNENQILIGSLDRSRAHDIKVLFILGINDGILPESGSDQALISDLEKSQLNTDRGQILSDSEMFLDKETFNIYSAVTRPSENLYLSYAKSDAEGHALRESYLITKAKKIALGIKTTRDQIVGPTDPLEIPLKISMKSASWNHMAYELRRYLDGMSIHDAWFQTLNWFATIDRPRVTQLLHALSYENKAPAIPPKLLEQLYELPIKTSVSRLEEFVQCPFKYFVSVGLTPYEPKTFTLDYPDVGILLHKALEAFGKEIYDQGLNWTELDRAYQESLVDSIVDAMVDNALFQSKYHYRYMIYKLKRVARRSVATLTEHLTAGSFVPRAFELAFSDTGQGVPPIIIPLDSGEKIFLRGVIDRIDFLDKNGETFVKIIDYKSGNKQLSLSDVYNGLQMQLMVYLDACLEHPAYFKVDQLFPAGAFYYRIDDPMIETVDDTKETIEKEILGRLKMDGLVVEDLELIKGFDANFPDEKKSAVVNVKLKVDGDFTKDSKTISEDHLYQVIDWVKGNIKSIGGELLKGRVDISPCRSTSFVSCTYCHYKALCQFDPKFQGNAYRQIKDYSDDEVIEKIQAGGPHGKLDN